MSSSPALYGSSPKLQSNKAFKGDAWLHKLTLPGVLISLVVNQVSHTAAIVQPLLMVEGLERLAGAVGLLCRHTAFICIQGGGVILGIFGAAAPGQGAVPTILQIHAEVGCGGWGVGMDAGRRDGNGGGGEGGGGRWRGLLAGLRNVNLHFSHLENRDRERERWREWKRQRKVGIKLMDALL